MPAAPPSPPTGILPRFSLLVAMMRRGLGEAFEHRRVIAPVSPLLRPLAELLWHYLGHTLRRLRALQARFAAGKLPAPRRRAAPSPAAERPARTHQAPTRRPDIPRGPVFLEFGLGWAIGHLEALLDDPETRALLAASPQAGRLLRPLWRKLSPDPLPEVLRPPPRPPRPKPPRLARAESRGGDPSPRPSPQPSPPSGGEGEVRRPAWARPRRRPALPAWPPPLWWE